MTYLEEPGPSLKLYHEQVMTLYKTQGIVFNFIKYKETSIICRIFTEKFGMRSYMIKGIRRKKSNIAFYQPLTQLELLVTERENRDIQQIREAKVAYAYAEIPYEIKKTSIALFLAEVLYKSVREESAQEDLFAFITESLMRFDALSVATENFHLQFLLKLSRFLGFGLSEVRPFFEQTGRIALPNADAEALVNKLLHQDYGTPIHLNGQIRRQLLQNILRFYNLNLESFGRVRSLEVLQSLF